MIQFDEGSISVLNNSVPSMESIRNNQILHDDVLAHAKKEKTRMTPSPTCSSKLPSSNHTFGEAAEDQGRTCGHRQHAQE